MANRSRENRHDIPGYDETRPSREERKQSHRQVRHNTHQMLHMADDPEEVAGLPEVRKSGKHDAHISIAEPEKKRFRVWKTKFWKRRGEYSAMKSEMDANWPVITPDQLYED
jgi:hypothetical protein